MKTLHFLYHELRAAKSSYAYLTTRDEFAAHCASFAKLRKEQGAERLLPAITFDDGNLSDYTLAAPALAQHGLYATFFVTAGWINQRPGFLDWAQLRELQAAGHTIGAHGFTHKLLTQCLGSERTQELVGARKRLEDGLGTAVTCMSLPGGRADRSVFHACTEAGYLQVFTSAPHAVDLHTNPKILGRLNLTRKATVPWLERVLDPRSGTLKKLEHASKLKDLAKQALGDRLYAKLWAVVNQQEEGMAAAEVRGQ